MAPKPCSPCGSLCRVKLSNLRTASSNSARRSGSRQVTPRGKQDGTANDQVAPETVVKAGDFVGLGVVEYLSFSRWLSAAPSRPVGRIRGRQDRAGRQGGSARGLPSLGCGWMPCRHALPAYSRDLYGRVGSANEKVSSIKQTAKNVSLVRMTVNRVRPHRGRGSSSQTPVGQPSRLDIPGELVMEIDETGQNDPRHLDRRVGRADALRPSLVARYDAHRAWQVRAERCQ